MVRALPLSQFYEVSYDMDWPYNVYGGLQDNGSWQGPSRGLGGIQNRHWNMVGGGDGFHTYRDPHDPNIVYAEFQGGNLLRYHPATNETKQIYPLPAEGESEQGTSFLQLNPAAPRGTGFYVYKMEPGARSVPHRHGGAEEFLIIEGTLIDNDGTIYETGDLVWLAPGTEHTSWTETGCLIAVYAEGEETAAPE